jgi:hypothetical protein
VGGRGILNLHASEGECPGSGATSGYFDGERSGVAPYAEAGVEMLRLQRYVVPVTIGLNVAF